VNFKDASIVDCRGRNCEGAAGSRKPRPRSLQSNEQATKEQEEDGEEERVKSKVIYLP